MINELMKDTAMVKEMLKMQKALNDSIMEKKGLVWNHSKFNETNLDLAIVDEVGELNHELKKKWCWWKDTQPDVDTEKALEELVDIWHFVLSKYYLNVESKLHNEDYIKYLIRQDLLRGTRLAYEDLASGNNPIIEFIQTDFDLDNVVALTVGLGFDIENVYREYLKKNKENYERLERGY